MAVELSLRAPSGSVLTLGLPDDPRVSGVTTIARFAGSRFARGLQIGPLGFQEVANQSLMPATVIDRFVVGGHEVRMAVGLDGQNASVALIGRYHEVMTVYSGPPPRVTDVAEMFSQFTYEDAPEGMTIRPRSGTGLGMASEGLSVFVDGRGSLSIPGVANARDLIPKHAGTRTRFGELWRDGPLDDRPDQGARAWVYILGTTTAAAEIIFTDRSESHGINHPMVSDATLMAWLNELNPRWVR